MPGTGGPEHIYQSCIDVPKAEATMEGTFRFAVGTLEEQHGPAFDVQVCPRTAYCARSPDLFTRCTHACGIIMASVQCLPSPCLH